MGQDWLGLAWLGGEELGGLGGAWRCGARQGGAGCYLRPAVDQRPAGGGGLTSDLGWVALQRNQEAPGWKVQRKDASFSKAAVGADELSQEQEI